MRGRTADGPPTLPTPTTTMTPLKLIALDAEDLAVVSAHLQDAVVRVGDMTYLPREGRFAALLNRFDWLRAVESAAGGAAMVRERRRSGLRFERVLGARLAGIDLQQKGRFLELLALRFEAGDAPAGRVRLDFAGGGAIELEVECIEAELRDLGAVWRTKRVPDHGVGEAGGGEPGAESSSGGDRSGGGGGRKTNG